MKADDMLCLNITVCIFKSKKKTFLRKRLVFVKLKNWSKAFLKQLILVLNNIYAIKLFFCFFE